MTNFEFKVVPAPKRPQRLKGVARTEDKFCATLSNVITDMGLEGWEFVGVEHVPLYGGFFSLWSHKVRTCMVFRRELEIMTDADFRMRPRRVTRVADIEALARGRRIAVGPDPLLAETPGAVEIA